VQARKSRLAIKFEQSIISAIRDRDRQWFLVESFDIAGYILRRRTPFEKLLPSEGKGHTFEARRTMPAFAHSGQFEACRRLIREA
jgi:hypothetical protein